MQPLGLSTNLEISDHSKLTNKIQLIKRYVNQPYLPKHYKRHLPLAADKWEI